MLNFITLQRLAPLRRQPMATLAQLEAEAPWRDEFVPQALKDFSKRISARFDCKVFHKGDQNHLEGRHRSRRWSLKSEFCTDRAYGTSDKRDKTGPENAIR